MSKGKQFYGCQNYPRCREMKPVTASASLANQKRASKTRAGSRKVVGADRKKVNEMTTDEQKKAAEEKIKKAQLGQPEGRKRAKPGAKGEGGYFRIVVRSKEEFTTFRYHDVGEKGHILRLAGKRSSGSWDTQVWLISKDDAHIESDTLVADTADARGLIEALESKPKHIKGDIFEAKDRPNVPESEKPTDAQQRARLENIKKAQRVRQTSMVRKE